MDSRCPVSPTKVRERDQDALIIVLFRPLWAAIQSDLENALKNHPLITNSTLPSTVQQAFARYQEELKLPSQSKNTNKGLEHIRAWFTDSGISISQSCNLGLEGYRLKDIASGPLLVEILKTAFRQIELENKKKALFLIDVPPSLPQRMSGVGMSVLREFMLDLTHQDNNIFGNIFAFTTLEAKANPLIPDELLKGNKIEMRYPQTIEDLKFFITPLWANLSEIPLFTPEALKQFISLFLICSEPLTPRSVLRYLNEAAILVVNTNSSLPITKSVLDQWIIFYEDSLYFDSSLE